MLNVEMVAIQILHYIEQCKFYQEYTIDYIIDSIPYTIYDYIYF